MDDQTRISKSINHTSNQLEHLYPSIFGLSPDVKLSSIVLPSSGYRHLYRDLSTFIAKENARPRLIREPSVDENELQKQQLSLQGKNDRFMVSCSEFISLKIDQQLKIFPTFQLPSMCPFHFLGFYWPFVRIDKTRYEFILIKFFASTP